MFDGIWGGRFLGSRVLSQGQDRQAARKHRPRIESLEDRQLLAASIAPVPDVSVPATLGYQVPLNGSASGSVSQNFTVTSSNPSIGAAVSSGKYLTLTVAHQQANPDDVLIANSPITFQLFNDLTPLTAGTIESIAESGFYDGKTFHRVASGFPTSTDYIVQGGSATGTGAGASGQPGTPFVDEFVQQLAFTGKYQLAMANSGPDTNDTQFFITTGSPEFLNFKHTVFGEVVSGFQTVDKMTQVAKDASGTPTSPIQINSATVSDTNPNGVVYIDATGARPGDTSDITVTATDPTTNTTAVQTFKVTVGEPNQNSRAFIQQLPYPTQVVTTTPGTPTQPAVVYSQNVAVNQKNIFRIPAVDPEGDPLTYIVKGGVTTNPSTGATTFSEVPAAQGTASVDQSTGIVTVTPAQGFTGQMNLLVGVRDQTNRGGGSTSLDDPSNFSYHQIILNVAGTTPVALNPIAVSFDQGAAANQQTQIQLQGVSANPATSTGLTYTLISQPTHGTISGFDASTGTLVYTANPNFEGSDTFQYSVTDHGTGSSTLTSNVATVTLNVGQALTGTVRQIGNVLVVTPAPRTDRGANQIVVSQIGDASNPSGNKIQVSVNGVIDQVQPLVSDIDRVVVYGSKASDRIIVSESLDPAIRVTLDGGHGGRNVIQAGAGVTRAHGWFGSNLLRGGSGENFLIGRQGRVKFVPSPATRVVFAGKGHPPRKHEHTTPPSGSFNRPGLGRTQTGQPIQAATQQNGQRAQLQAQRQQARAALQASQATHQNRTPQGPRNT